MMALISFSQTLVKSREAVLKKIGYTITGKAFLEEYSNGALKLRLDEDFATPSGPDVQVLLSKTTSTAGALPIANLVALNHFSGAITFDVPANTTIEEYQYILFHCVAFNASWANGNFGAAVEVEEPYTCQETLTATTGWVTEISICSTDGKADSIPLLNNLFIPSGENYAFVLTDTNEFVKGVVYDSIYDFEGAGNEPIRVYGVNYSGELNNITIGGGRERIGATGCRTHSGGNLYLTVKMDGCVSGFKDQELTGIDIYPNPVSSQLTINSASENGVANLLIQSIGGSTIYQSQIKNKLELDLQQFEAGVYLIKIESDNKVLTRKLIVE